MRDNVGSFREVNRATHIKLDLSVAH